MRSGQWRRLQDEVAQAWNVALKDVRVYYLTPPMIMFGLMMPFFMFFSFLGAEGDGSSAGHRPAFGIDDFFYCFLSRAGDHPLGTANGYL